MGLSGRITATTRFPYYLGSCAPPLPPSQRPRTGSNNSTGATIGVVTAVMIVGLAVFVTWKCYMKTKADANPAQHVSLQEFTEDPCPQESEEGTPDMPPRAYEAVGTTHT